MFEPHPKLLEYTKAQQKKFSLVYTIFANFAKQQAAVGRKDFFA
jgi:hypothetical protein